MKPSSMTNSLNILYDYFIFSSLSSLNSLYFLLLFIIIFKIFDFFIALYSCLNIAVKKLSRSNRQINS